MRRPRLHGYGGLIALGLFCSLAHADGTLSDVSVPKPLLKELKTNFHDVDVLKARDAALARLKQLATRGSPTRLGFTSAKVDGLDTLDPIQEAFVSVPSLKGYVATQDPLKLLTLRERFLFPVVQAGKVISSVTVAKLRGGWQPAAYGAPDVIRAVMRQRFDASNHHEPGGAPLLHPGTQANYILVTMSGMNLIFLGAQGPGGFYLIPLRDSPSRKLTAGIPSLARDVFVRLIPEANALNGLPT